MSNENQNKKKEQPKDQRISQMVRDKVNFFKETGEIHIKPNFSPENAIKSALMIISELKDKNKNRAIDVCTEGSISQSLFRMIMLGLSPRKGQCSFVVYGKELQLQKEYPGNIKLAKENGLKSIKAQVIYKDEKPNIKIDPETGRTLVVNHNREFSKMDNDNIVGAYAVCVMNDGTTDVEVMTMSMIETAWDQGYMKGNSPAHRNFRDQMCKKTVINRACKLIYKTADDSQLFGLEENTYEDAKYEDVSANLKDTKANQQDEEVSEELTEEAESTAGTQMPNFYEQPEPEKEKANEKANEKVADQPKKTNSKKPPKKDKPNGNNEPTLGF